MAIISQFDIYLFSTLNDIFKDMYCQMEHIIVVSNGIYNIRCGRDMSHEKTCIFLASCLFMDIDNLHCASKHLCIVKHINSYAEMVASLVLITFICFIQENHSSKKTSQ